MASAILVRGNESAFDGNIYRRYPTQRPPAPFVTFYDDSTATLREGDVSVVKFSSPPPVSSSSSRGDLVTFDLGSYQRSELKALRQRLVSELQRVRDLLTQIESTRPVYPPAPAARLGSSRPELESGNPILINGGNKKKGGGLKRVNPNNGGVKGWTRKKRALDENMKKCAQILSKLMNQKHSWVFNKPVDVVAMGLHDYYQVIKTPMDLGTVKANLAKGLYKSPAQFAADVRLTFNNAMTYNPVDDNVYLRAESLAKSFDQMFNSAYNELGTTRKGHILSNVGAPELRMDAMWDAAGGRNVSDGVSAAKRVDSAVDKPRQGVLGARGKLKKPRANDPFKREMTLDEKLKLGLSLQELPQAKMAQLMMIVSKGNGCFSQHLDEIELDIEKVDNETLWELDRFVNSCKRVAGKMKKKQQGDLQDVNESAFSEMATETLRIGGDAGEEDVDIGDELPTASFPPVEIERDDNAMSAYANSVSSSGSDSSGESSGSDSDSGSSSDSDEDDKN